MRRLPVRFAVFLTVCLAAAPPLYAATEQWVSTGPSGGRVDAFAMHPSNPAVIYAATKTGVIKSVDGGQTWLRTSPNVILPWVLSLALHPDDPNLLIAGTQSGVYRTKDGGLTWSFTGVFGQIFDVEIDAVVGVIYAAATSSIFRSTD